jgi:hypothetical protein
LNEDFINIWVSNVALERTPRKEAYMAKRPKNVLNQFDKNHPFAKAIMEGWKEHSPVDCLVIAPEGDVMGKLPFNDFFDECYENNLKEEDVYMQFLKDSLDAKFPGFDEDTSDPLLTGLNVILTEENPKQEVIHIYRTPRYGYQDYNVITIDATTFKDGGKLTIDIKVGSAKAGGSFDLYDGDTELPLKGYPDGAIASAWDIPTGQRGRIEYQFEKGKLFKLGATGTWFSGKGNINAFQAQISVEQIEKKGK